MKSGPGKARIATIAMMAMIAAGCSHDAPTANPISWNAKLAATYLDQREHAWSNWQPAARDHATFCVSCHTAVLYALARPTLRQANGDRVASPTSNEQELLDNVTKRVRLWNEIGPYYHDEGYKAEESRGTESVLNALILANNDAQNGHLNDVTRSAFDHMWALQHTTGDDKGSWSWLHFNLEPWEANDSPFYGATLAAVAVGISPDSYRTSVEIHNQIELLRAYLDREYPRQSTINRATLLWASTKLPGLITSERKQQIIDEIFEAQQSDGGWRLSSLAWPRTQRLKSWLRTQIRLDYTSQERQSDGYATGLIVLALQDAGGGANEPTLAPGTFVAAPQSKSTRRLLAGVFRQ